MPFFFAFSRLSTGFLPDFSCEACFSTFLVVIVRICILVHDGPMFIAFLVCSSVYLSLRFLHLFVSRIVLALAFVFIAAVAFACVSGLLLILCCSCYS